MENSNEQQIIGELIPYIEELFKKFPEIDFQVHSNQSFTFISNVSTDYRRFEFDIVIRKNDSPFIIIEIKSESFLRKAKPPTLISIASIALDITKASYYIFTDGIHYLLIDGTNFFKYSEITKERLEILLKNVPESRLTHDNISYLFNTIKDEFTKLGLTKKWNEFVGDNKAKDVFVYEPNTLKYFYKGDPSDLNGYENQFFQKLLPEIEGEIETVFRYTTGQALESLLKYNTYRMNGIVGQNDPTEVDYFDDKVFGGRKPFDELNQEKLEQINKVFVSSCVLKEKGDDLTMWRLYSEDSKGVCYKLKVHKDRFDHHILLKRVSYGEETSHKQLDAIKNILKKFKEERSAIFEFKTLETWKHFFKPFQYKVEEEVRLLYIKNDTLKPIKEDWVVTFADKIYNPCVDFKLNSEQFPLELVEITLGPNSPYKSVNKSQLKEYIRQLRLKKKKDNQGNETDEYDYKIEDLDVIISKINNYRKT